MKYYSTGDGDGGAAVLNNYIKMQTFILHELIQSRIGRYIAPIINNRFLEHGRICISIIFFSNERNSVCVSDFLYHWINQDAK